MTTDEAIKFFGDVVCLARFVGVSKQHIYKWGEFPPMKYQDNLQKRTEGKLMAELDEETQWIFSEKDTRSFQREGIKRHKKTEK